MSLYNTKRMIKEFLSEAMCIDPNADWITYRIYVDEDGGLWDTQWKNREEIIEVVTLNEEQTAHLNGNPYLIETETEFEEIFDDLLNRLTDDYVEKFGYWDEYVEDENMNKIELGYYNEDTKAFHYCRGLYATYGEAMKAADNAGDWFETVIGDHRAIDVIMSLADYFEIDPDWFDSMDELVEEVKRQHKLAPVKEDILTAGYRMDVDAEKGIVSGVIYLDKNDNISDEDHFHAIVAYVCFDEDEAMDENEEFNEELIVNKKCDEVLDSLAEMLYEHRKEQAE